MATRDSNVSPRYAPASVAKTRACIPLVNIPSRNTGTGTQNGTKLYNTARVNSSARMLPRSRKLRDNGLENSSRRLIGSRNGTGFRYFARNPSLYSVNPVKKVAYCPRNE